MPLCRTSYRDKRGRKRRSATWSIRFTDHRGIRRRLSGFKDKRATAALERNVQALVAVRMSGLAPDAVMVRWTETLPEKTVKRLAEFGLLDGTRLAMRRPITDHADDYKDDLLARGRTEEYAKLQVGRIKTVAEGCGFMYVQDIAPAPLMKFLDDKRKLEDMSTSTVNHYITAVKGFMRWMVKNRRAEVDPLQYLSKLNARTDIRRKRKPLSVEELARLILAASTEPTRHGMDGPQRALVYLLAVETGLRASELKSLTRSSFDLNADPPTVTVLAAYSKRRRDDTLPLWPRTAELLRKHLEHKLPAAEAFTFHAHPRYATMLKTDLAAAREAWLKEAQEPDERRRRERTTFLLPEDERGRVVDFHGLRHTFGTQLAAADVHPKIAQSLMRHSTITLTMDRYSHSLIGQDADAVKKLPDFTTINAGEKPATGTEKT